MLAFYDDQRVPTLFVDLYNVLETKMIYAVHDILPCWRKQQEKHLYKHK